MNRKKDFLKDIIVIIIVLAFVMPVAVFANDEMVGVTSNSENTSDMENVVEIFTNSNEVTTSDTIARDTFGQYMYYDDGEDSGWCYESGMTEWDTEMISVVDTDTYIDSGNTEVLPTTGVTIYVGSGGGNDSTTIQGGIDLANPAGGDTVYVYNGIYYENVVVDKQLDLIGESRENVIVDGSGSGKVVYVTANEVNISIFTMRNGQYGIYIKSSDNNVMNCDICSNTYYGIYLYGSSNNDLTGNAIYDNVYNLGVATVTWPADINDFYHDIDTTNTINGKPIYYLVEEEDITLDGLDNNFGFLGLISCTRITAKNSDVTGVLVIDTTDSMISNIISHNSKDGIYFWMSSDNRIINCNAYNNGDNGIYFKSSPRCDIINCNAYNNNNGIYLWQSSNCDIIICNSYNNSGYGIYLWQSSNCKLEGNTIYDNVYNFCVAGGVSTEYFYQDIDTSNTVNEKLIYYLVGKRDLELNETHNIGFLGLVSCTNIIAKNSDVTGVLVIDTTDSTIDNVDSHNSGTGIGIYIKSSSDNDIINCSSYNNSGSSIYLDCSPRCNIVNCDSYNNQKGISIFLSSDCNIMDCDFYNNSGTYGYGIYLTDSPRCDIINCNSYNNNNGISIWYSSNCKLEGNTIYDNVYNFGIEGKMPDQFYHDIDTSNTVNGKPIYYLVDDENLMLDETYNIGFLGMVSCTNITAKNTDVGGILVSDTTDSTISNVSSHNSANGIFLIFSSYNNIVNCNAYDNYKHGIYLGKSSYNDITNCNAYNNGKFGISLEMSSTNNIMNCNLYNNNRGLDATTSSKNNNIVNCSLYNNIYRGLSLSMMSNYNLFHHNNFVNNGQNVRSMMCSNTWDNGSAGNYWDTYTGVDADGDGIGDTAFNIRDDGEDRFPLMDPWKDTTSPLISDVILTTSDPFDTDPLFGWENVTCTVTDFQVRDVKLVVTYPDVSTVTVEYPMIKDGDTYSYETTFTDAGDYTYHIWADDTSDNIAESTPEQTFVLPENWDMNDDRICDISDLRMVALKFGETGLAGWIREDYNNDGICDISDLMMVVIEFGETY